MQSGSTPGPDQEEDDEQPAILPFNFTNWLSSNAVNEETSSALATVQRRPAPPAQLYFAAPSPNRTISDCDANAAVRPTAFPRTAIPATSSVTSPQSSGTSATIMDGRRRDRDELALDAGGYYDYESPISPPFSDGDKLLKYQISGTDYYTAGGHQRQRSYTIQCLEFNA
ncbi:hypothetical protein Tcan_09484 [Toxocara canis]|uniref:Uncharacterized protein n=1 Tax=Toxocara canis TaxID=6265 RepID=A0A0B2VZR1_TOXCA|nr:hypothetical protein Tcan_09484 [Toxocara canis]